MRIFNRHFLSDIWFGFVMSVTRILPEIQPTLRLRGFLARPAFNSCGHNLQITRDVRIGKTHNLSIGNNVYLSGGSWILASAEVKIENEVMVGPYVIIITGNHTLKNGSYRYGEAVRAPITLKRGSWIGSHGVILKGVTVGQGTLVAAGTVVTKSLPDLCIAGGQPARIIKENVVE